VSFVKRISSDGHGAYLTTDREYGDLEPLIEYMAAARVDSDIYLRGTPLAGAGFMRLRYVRHSKVPPPAWTESSVR
jgi:hypothetical protein